MVASWCHLPRTCRRISQQTSPEFCHICKEAGTWREGRQHSSTLPILEVLHWFLICFYWEESFFELSVCFCGRNLYYVDIHRIHYGGSFRFFLKNPFYALFVFISRMSGFYFWFEYRIRGEIWSIYFASIISSGIQTTQWFPHTRIFKCLTLFS